MICEANHLLPAKRAAAASPCCSVPGKQPFSPQLRELISTNGAVVLTCALHPESYSSTLSDTDFSLKVEIGIKYKSQKGKIT